MTSLRIRVAAAVLSPLVVIALTQPCPAAEPAAASSGTSAGIRPVGRDGRPLNLDFETGTLADWTAQGDAFAKQPVKGDTVARRRADQKSNHQGEYWVGGYELAGDDATGTLTSAPFKVTHRWASFLIGGGPWQETRVELLRADDHLTFYTFNGGREDETLRPIVVDLERHVGKEFYVKVIDERKGHWGHLNFDNFVFHAERPRFADELDPKKVTPPPPADVVKFEGLSPQEAAKAITLPEGFKATLFAAEPDVRQPVAFTIDPRGRLWVLECLTYPNRAPDGQGKDNIVIFEDTDGDGKADKRTLFAEGLNLATALEVGFGGVYVGAAPHLLFIPDRNGDDKPDGKPEVLLDGWGYQDTHETLNTFTWGPDGWLYGCQGVFTHSKVGKPGASDAERTKINAGIWRYHPVKQKFEVFAEGTSNPWGIDFDQHGQLWAEACVIPHLWHIIQGARYQRQAGQHFNPFTFDDIRQSADHVHYAGSQGPHAGNGRSDAAGGGHAHAGLMVYQGDNWPAEYRNKIFIGNIHGQRINVDIPEPKGSGYVGKHGPDFLNFNDTWSQVINFRTGPDGGVYFIDWYDRQQCHTPDYNAHDRSNGRIYKVTYGDKQPAAVDLAAMDDKALAALQLKQDNDTVVRNARRLLQERHAAGRLAPSVRQSLLGMLDGEVNDYQRLRVLWALHATGGVPEAVARGELRRTDRPYATAWAVQLLAEGGEVSPETLAEFVRLAKDSPVAAVRRNVTSALLRLPLEKRWDALAALLSKQEDATDHNLPLLYWYAFEPMATLDASRALAMALESKIPNILTFTVRRIGAMEGDAPLAALTANLARVDDEPKQAAILQGINESLRGRRSVSTPKGWEAVEAKLFDSNSPAVRSQVRTLGVTFGSAKAMAAMKKTLLDAAAPAPDRQAALDALLNAKAPDLAPMLLQLLNEPRIRGAALRGLAAYDDPAAPRAILQMYKTFDAQEKKDALATLASRARSGRELLAAVENGSAGISAKDISADVVRQLRNLQDKEIDKTVAKVWGVVQASNEDKLKRMAALKAVVESNKGPTPDAAHGRALFAKTCAQCHKLFDTGGQVGPDITGANRGDLAYLLENTVDPNAVIPIDYQASVLDTKDGRTVVGIVKKQDANAVTIMTNTETLVLPRNEVKTLRVSKLSMMPEGLLDTFSDAEIRSLIAYLKSPAQVPLPATPDTAKDFFNGKDLTGWVGRGDVWKVENGEIVGKTATGLKNNEFLRNELELTDFRLTFKVKLVPDTENSGVQFRSVPVPDSHEMKGYQADVGKGWWGKLYHESGRGLLWDKGAPDGVVKAGDWNTYEIVAVGHKIKTAVNGHPCVDLDDPQGELKGHVAVQVHSGGPTEVRFKDFELELNPEPKLKTAK
jgi:putative membrane-bound dehydrogenase-like protein